MTNAYQLPTSADEIAAFLANFDRLVAAGASVPMPLYSDEAGE